MEISQLYAFTEIADTGNLTKAACNLNISQSALSTKIKQLEDELCLSLFHRSSKGMELTSGGEQLIGFARNILNSAESMKTKAFSMNNKLSETLTIGLNTDPASLKIAEMNARLSADFPHLNIIFMASETRKTEEMLKRGKIDLGFCFDYDMPDDIERSKIADVPICVVIPKSFCEDPEKLSHEDIAKMPWVWTFKGCPFYQELRREFEGRGIEPERVIKTEDENIVKELVKEGQGVAIMQQSIAERMVEEGYVTIWPLKTYKVSLYIAWLLSRSNDQMFKSFGHTIKNVWKS